MVNIYLFTSLLLSYFGVVKKVILKAKSVRMFLFGSGRLHGLGLLLLSNKIICSTTFYSSIIFT